MKLMPQEIEVWYLLPALRREIALELINKYKFSQREISEILGITESAVSQYLKSKRANELKFSNSELIKIKKCVKEIFKDKDNVRKHYLIYL